MKTRMLVSILILVLAVLIIIGGCETTPKTQEEREDVNQEVFFQAVKSGDYAEVKRLIEEGADVNAQNNDGWTALMWATHYGYPEFAKLLIDKGADINAQNNKGLTALGTASVRGKTKAAKLLIEEGADINVQDTWGHTALEWALREGYPEIAELLREAGAKE